MVKNEMIERGALAIKAVVDCENARHHNFTISTPESIAESYRAKARAVIEVMRNPTPAIKAVKAYSIVYSPEEIWRDMIDAALTEEEA